MPSDAMQFFPVRRYSYDLVKYALPATLIITIPIYVPKNTPGESGFTHMKQAANISRVVVSFIASPTYNQRTANDADTAADCLNTYLTNNALGSTKVSPPSSEEWATALSTVRNNRSANTAVIPASTANILCTAARFL
ncbi:MAG: hypothetical protein WDZ86_07310 [Gammaproteobacteria bacterium]